MKLDERFSLYRERLNENDRLIWKYIRAHTAECQGLSINTLAERCNVSRTTVLRFAKKLGLSGYAELKLILKQDSERPQTSPDALDRAERHYLNIISQMHGQNCDAVFKLIDNAKGLYLYSDAPRQEDAARTLAHRFLGAGKMFCEIGSAWEGSRILQQMTPSDAVLILAQNGETPEAAAFARALKLCGVPFAAITGLYDTVVARLSDVCLSVSSPDAPEEACLTAGLSILVEMLFLKYREYHARQEKENGSEPAD